MSQVIIDEHVDLLALHRVFVELHFITNPNDADVIGSSLIARIANQVLDAIIAKEIDQGRGDTASRWRDWRRIDRSRREWPLLVTQLKAIELWNTMSLALKKETVCCYASPFEVNVDEVINDVEAAGIG